jgi:hypothetical protein
MWSDAHRSLTLADREAGPSPDGLEQLATAAYMLGRDDEYLAATERAYHAHLDAGDPVRAARCAAWLSVNLLQRGELARATGWTSRAGRLLERAGGDCAERGYVLLPVIIRGHIEGDDAASYAAAAAATEIAERFGDADLHALAVHEQGLSLINLERDEEGLRLLDEAMVAVHYYWRTEYAAALDDGLLATWRDLAAECPVPDAEMGFLHVGGALNELAADDGAVGNRDARYVCGALRMWDPGDPREAEYRDWVREAGRRLQPFSTGGGYINFQTADEAGDRIRAAYEANYDRLAVVKRAYDPGNVFRSNRNVPPAGG